MELTERQQEIIDVSLKLIAQNGIQGLTIKNLAHEIGFSESAIYRHYENKIQILVAILQFFKENTDHLLSTRLLNEGTAVSRINRFFESQFLAFSASPSLVAVIFSEELFRNEEILFRTVAGILENNLTALTEILRTGQEKGEIRADVEAAHLALLVLGTLRLFVKQWHISGYSFNLNERGKRLSESLSLLLAADNYTKTL